MGGLCLLYVAVPLEARLRAAGLPQGQIDRALQVVIAVWGLVSLLVAWLYGRSFLAAGRRPGPALGVAGLSLAVAGAVFALFLHTGSGLVALTRGGRESLGERFTFGPYPDLAALQQLKAEGYGAVVSLLSPAIPFEQVLLDQEIANAKKVGLKVYSFPMLPWVSDNAGALASIKALAAGSQQRLYFHCYLGKHRVLLVQEMLAAQGDAPEAVLEPLPASLERGPIRAYEGERILVGPYPTDEEWFAVLLRRQVKEVVLTLDPANPDNQPWLDQASKIAQGYGIVLSSYPLSGQYPDPAAVKQIATYVRGLDHKVYVLGFKAGNWQTALDQALSGGEPQAFRPELPAQFERGNLLKLGDRVLFGPFPTDDEVTLLKAYGVQTVVTLLDDKSADDQPWLEKEQRWATARGLTLQRFPLPAAGGTAAQVQAVVKFLKASQGAVYVHGFLTDGRAQAVYAAARAQGVS